MSRRLHSAVYCTDTKMSYTHGHTKSVPRCTPSSTPDQRQSSSAHHQACALQVRSCSHDTPTKDILAKLRLQHTDSMQMSIIRIPWFHMRKHTVCSRHPLSTAHSTTAPVHSHSASSAIQDRLQTVHILKVRKLVHESLHLRVWIDIPDRRPCLSSIDLAECVRGRYDPDQHATAISCQGIGA